MCQLRTRKPGVVEARRENREKRIQNGRIQNSEWEAAGPCEHAEKNGLRLLAWCLMSNHVHVVAVPERARSLAGTFRHAHGRFAQCWNTLERRVGHMWQNRFYSCAVEPHEVWRVIRYVE